MSKSQLAESTPFSFTPYQIKENEEYMNEAQLEHFRTILLNWKSELMEEVDRTVHYMQDDASWRRVRMTGSDVVETTDCDREQGLQVGHG